MDRDFEQKKTKTMHTYSVLRELKDTPRMVEMKALCQCSWALSHFLLCIRQKHGNNESMPQGPDKMSDKKVKFPKWK